MKNTFGQTIRKLRTQAGFTQRDLAAKVGINFTYLSKIENDRLHQVPAPSEETILGLAKALNVTDADGLLLLARKIPDSIKKRVLQRPEAFFKIAALSDDELDLLMKQWEKENDQRNPSASAERCIESLIGFMPSKSGFDNFPLADKLENILYSNELDDETNERLQDFCCYHAKPAWATGGSIVEAADLLVERAIENANLQVKEVNGERIIRFNQG